MLGNLEISASGLEAHRLWMNTIAENIANANTIERDGANDPYRRREPIFSVRASGNARAVEVKTIVEDPSPFRMEHDPNHPLANPDGKVAYPNVQVIQEMVDMMMANRSYEANVTAMEVTKSMFSSALRILA